jgi:DNA-binding PadR family transcriptional regulator
MSPQRPQFGQSQAKRFFENGVLRCVLLDLLKDKSAHGYELIKALEKRSQGFYTPSTGSIYPILQMLQDQDYVTSVEKTGKMVYTITERGLNYLHENSDIINGLHNLAAHGGLLSQSEWSETAEDLKQVASYLGKKQAV